jgi:hypothetical protein
LDQRSRRGGAGGVRYLGLPFWECRFVIGEGSHSWPHGLIRSTKNTRGRRTNEPSVNGWKARQSTGIYGKARRSPSRQGTMVGGSPSRQKCTQLTMCRQELSNGESPARFRGNGTRE